MQSLSRIGWRPTLCRQKLVRARWICASAPKGAEDSIRSSTTAARQLPQQPARTRFAPSPTGYLHLGSLRTALFNYLLAKSTGGQFLLRIEDTDQKRTVADAEERLYQDLLWAGLPWDEGPQVGGAYGPYKQSERLHLYKEQAERLVESGHAYRCFCSTERLNSLAEERHKLGLPTHYDRTCTHISKAESDERAHRKESHVIRLRSPPQYPEFTDLVYGKVRARVPKVTEEYLSTYEDPVLMKSDGFPTYHLANVVDDHFMKITHVVRGAEWMSSTPKHIAMYEAFGWKPPAFAHVGLLVDQQRQKLSKRKFDIDISSFRDKMGVFPETLANFLALLGWSHRLKSDVMSSNELIANFDMHFTTGDTVVTMDKLWFLQRAHAERYINYGNPITDKMAADVLAAVEKDGKQADIEMISDLMRADAGNFTTATQFYERNIYFFTRPTQSVLKEVLQPWVLQKVPEHVAQEPQGQILIDTLAPLKTIPEEEWDAANLRTFIAEAIKTAAAKTINSLEIKDSESQLRVGKAWSRLMYKYLRWVMTAGKSGPDSSVTMALVGREETIARFEIAYELTREYEKEQLQGTKETA